MVNKKTKLIAVSILVIMCLILASVSMLLFSTDPTSKKDDDDGDKDPDVYQPMTILEDADDFVQESESTIELWNAMDEQTEFTNAYYGYYGNSTNTNSYDQDGDLGAPSDEDDRESNAGAGDKSSDREIEEADIVKIVDNTMYILNTYRGLIIVDITDPNQPAIIGRQQMFGQPVDMYVVDTKAYIVLSSYYYYGFRFLEVGGDSIWTPYNWEGSQICIVDITDSTDPFIINTIELEGEVTDTRRVGDVIYAVSSEFDYYWMQWDTFETEWGRRSESQEEEYTGPNTYVVSINFEDPENILEVDRVEFPGTSNEIHVTQFALYVAQPNYGDESSGYEPYTDVTYVDISDPFGLIDVRDSFRAEGRLEDRYQMDHYDDTFRMVTHFWSGIGESKLWVYDVSNPDEISKLGELLIDDAGTLMATRFEEERAYTIHLPRSIDPLDTIDLSDPTSPELCDVLEMPGWVEHIEIRGFKLLALGVDDSDGQRKVAVSLFDVTDPYNTELKDRVTIGEGYSWSGANWDPKALSVIDDQNIILVPFTSYVYDETSRDSTSMNGVQIVEFDLDNNDLTARGVIENAADQVLRTRAYRSRILSTSNYFLQVIDADDMDNPEITAQLELCTDIKDLAIIDDYAVQLVDTWWDEDNRYKFRVVDEDDPDGYPPDHELNIGNPDYCLMYTNGDMVYLFTSDYEYYYDYYDTYSEPTYESAVTIYDFSDPLNPQERGSLELPFYIGYYYRSPYVGYMPTDNYYWYYSPSDLLQMDGNYFVYHPGSSYYYYDYYYGTNEVKDGTGEESDYNERIYIADLSNPDDPQSLPEYEFDTFSIQNMNVRGRMVYYTDLETISNEEYGYGWTDAKYYLGRIDLTDPYNPNELDLVNIPGTFVDANNDGSVIYTLSTWFETEDEVTTQFQTFNVLTLSYDIATLKSAIQVDGTIRSIYIEDGLAYFTMTNQETQDEEPSTGEGSSSGGTSEETSGTEGAPVESEKATSSDAAYYPYYNYIEVHMFMVYDLSNVNSPEIIYELELCDYGFISEVNGGYVVLELSWSNGLLMFDFTDPTAPAALGFFLIRGSVNNVLIHEPTETVYVVSGYYGVYMAELKTV
jgi:hypothetical protein